MQLSGAGPHKIAKTNSNSQRPGADVDSEGRSRVQRSLLENFGQTYAERARKLRD